MQKLHVTVIALFLAGAAVLGAVAIARTTGLGTAARQTKDAAVLARAHQLTLFAAKLQKELRARPPALPPMPKPQTAPVPAPAAAPAAAPRVIYHQPPPIVVTVRHRNGDDDSHESDGGDGGAGDG
jgi:hypothetical protein